MSPTQIDPPRKDESDGCIPDGWKLVPIEPTPDMLSAAGASFIDGIGTHIAGDNLNANTPFRLWFRAMLSAAPTPPITGRAPAASDVSERQTEETKSLIDRISDLQCHFGPQDHQMQKLFAAILRVLSAKQDSGVTEPAVPAAACGLHLITLLVEDTAIETIVRTVQGTPGLSSMLVSKELTAVPLAPGVTEFREPDTGRDRDDTGRA